MYGRVAHCTHARFTYRHVSTRITIVPAELFNAFRNSFGGPMRHSGKSVYGTRRSRRRGGRRTAGGSATAGTALGNLRWSWRGELVFGARECLLYRAHFNSVISSSRPGKHSSIYKRQTCEQRTDILSNDLYVIWVLLIVRNSCNT